MACFTGEIIDNQILFTCSITKATGEKHDLNALSHYGTLLDTGAQETSITRKIADELGLISSGWHNVFGVGGAVRCERCMIDLTIPIAKMARVQGDDGKIIKKQVSGLFFNSVNVSILEETHFNFDVLLGMDIITQCNFQIHSENLFTLCI
ncbi:MAG: retropepsin-like aspartic protease [Candidatus Halichondribacter symbioticus]